MIGALAIFAFVNFNIWPSVGGKPQFDHVGPSISRAATFSAREPIIVKNSASKNILVICSDEKIDCEDFSWLNGVNSSNLNIGKVTLVNKFFGLMDIAWIDLFPAISVWNAPHFPYFACSRSLLRPPVSLFKNCSVSHCWNDGKILGHCRSEVLNIQGNGKRRTFRLLGFVSNSSANAVISEGNSRSKSLTQNSDAYGSRSGQAS